MTKKRWFRFYVDRWRNGTFGMPPIERVVFMEMLCELYDHDGLARIDEAVMARRCELKPSRFRLALDYLVKSGKLNIEAGFYTNKAVSEEVAKREKIVTESSPTRNHLVTNSEPSRSLRGEKDNESKGNWQKPTAYTELRNQKTEKTLDDLRKRLGAEPLPPLSERAAAIGSRRAH